jgi:tetratricopeptide (TPR) repeat protein
LGIAAAKAGREAEAREHLMRVVELDERNEQGWLWLSSVVETLDDKRLCLENVLSINPSNSHALSGLRWLEQNAAAPQEEPERCPRCEASVPSSSSECPNCRLPLIIACPACGEYADVGSTTCPYCEHPLGDFRKGAAYHLALAENYLEHRRLERVEEALDHAAAEAGTDTQALSQVARLYSEIGLIDQAMAISEQIIEHDPKNAMAYVNLAAVHYQRQEFDQARELYEEAEKLARRDPQILCELARIDLQQGANDEAVKRLRQVVRRQSENAEAHLLLGDAYLAQNRLDVAAAEYDTASKLAAEGSPVALEAQRKIGELLATYQQRSQAGPSPAPSAPSRPEGRGRPGCVTLYAILLGILGLLGLLGVVLLALVWRIGSNLLSSSLGSRADLLVELLQASTPLLWISIGVTLLISGLYLVVAIGLWSIKNWARIVVILMTGLQLVLSLAQATRTILGLRETGVISDLASIPITLIVGLVVGLAIQMIILFWFVANRQVFD